MQTAAGCWRRGRTDARCEESVTRISDVAGWLHRTIAGGFRCFASEYARGVTHRRASDVAKTTFPGKPVAAAGNLKLLPVL